MLESQNGNQKVFRHFSRLGVATSTEESDKKLNSPFIHGACNSSNCFDTSISFGYLDRKEEGSR